MRYSRRLAAIAFVAVACRDTAPVDAAVLSQHGSRPMLRVTLVGAPADPRVPSVREAVAHWNDEMARLGRRVRLDSVAVHDVALPDALLRSAQREVTFIEGPAIARLRDRLSKTPGDIFVVLAGSDQISHGVPWHEGKKGIAVVRRSDIWPLSQPNTLRNVVAHELGHVLGLVHNADSTTLMCGRPATCRPTAFASDSAHFFPLTSDEDQWLKARWP